MSLKDAIIPELRKHFGHMDLRIDAEGEPFAVIMPVHEAWEGVRLFDDGEEITLEFAPFTHAHFGAVHAELDPEKMADAVASDVILVLKSTFDGGLQFHVSEKGGGYERAGEKFVRPEEKRYSWSGPVEQT